MCINVWKVPYVCRDSCATGKLAEVFINSLSGFVFNIAITVVKFT